MIIRLWTKSMQKVKFLINPAANYQTNKKSEKRKTGKLSHEAGNLNKVLRKKIKERIRKKYSTKRGRTI